MAQAKVVCGDCGNRVSPGDLYCPHCGGKLEWQEPGSPDPGTGPGKPEVVCGACGFRNTPGATFCQSCGAKLVSGARSGSGVTAGFGDRAGRARKKDPASPPRRVFSRPGGKGYRALFLVAGIVALGAAAVVIYTTAVRDNPPPARSAPSAPAGMAATSLRDIEPLQKAVDAHPRDPEALLRLANALQDNGMYMRATGIYKTYLALRPKDPNARVDLGICYFQLAGADSAGAPGLYASAVSEMERVVADDSTHQPAAFNLGVVELHRGNIQESNNWFRRAVRLNPASDLGQKAKKLLDEHTFNQQ